LSFVRRAKEKLLAQSRAAHLNSQMEAIIARTSPKDTPKDKRRDSPMSIPVVTIDGPAASGKSSVSRELARRLGWSWVSTGAFYRGLAYVANQLKIDLKDESALVKLATSDVWSVVMDIEKTRVILKGKDVTDEVNREEVGSLASVVSSHPQVRKALLDAQRRCASGVSGLVAEGRDCGTVVFPQANVKVFLTARSEDRAARRAKDEGASVSDTQAAQKIRDAQDANRKAAPMMASSDALTIDTSELSFNEVVSRVEGLVRSQVQLKQV
jgi:CMP/dCMP kinase